jgi:acetoacetyl-CoA synthetase
MSISPPPVVWKPSAERVAAAQLTRFRCLVESETGRELPDYSALHAWSIAEREAFWGAVWDFCEVIAAERGERVLVDGDRFPGARWFPEARLNFAANLLRGEGSQPAIVFRGEGGARRSLDHDTLRAEVGRVAAGMRAMGVEPGDRVAALMPNIPETVVVMLAAATLGAVFSSSSPDFGDAAVVDRFGQIEPKVLFCVDGYRYNGRGFVTADRLAGLLAALPSVETAVLVPYEDDAGPSSLAVDYRAFGAGLEIPAAVDLPFDHPLYVMFSSGTTGRPKCIVHSAGGTLLQHLKEHRLHADLGPSDRLFYFTTCGWMMWNWLASGLASGATLVLWDGSPFHPRPEALFDLVDEVGVTVFGASAKFVDACAKQGLAPRASHGLDSLRTILSTGSPLVPEAFDYVYEKVKPNVHLASISGGTDILSCFVLGDPTSPVRRGEIQCAGLGMAVEVFDEEGRAVVDQPGELVCTRAFPSAPIGFWGDPDGARYRAAYFERFPDVWCHGDWTTALDDGGFVIHGRSDAVLNPGGVRIGTAEIYREVESFDEVLEAIAVGQQWQDDVRVVLFVKLRVGSTLDEGLRERLRRRLRERASPRHVPARILEVADIPRTRSGKITELAVRDVIHGREVRNRGALANPEALEHFRQRHELEQ